MSPFFAPLWQTPGRMLSLSPLQGTFIGLGVAIYAVWFALSAPLKSSHPNALPKFPLRLIHGFHRTLLWLLSVKQESIFEESLEKYKQIMLVCVPHGAYAFSGTMFIGPEWRLQDSPECRGHTLFHGVASVLFNLPGVREFMLLIGARDASRKNIKDLFSRHPGQLSMSILPGGIWEQVNTRHDEERVYVQKKLGFIRLAIEEGLNLVPMYGFGENQVFTCHTWFNRFRLWVAKQYQVGLPIVTGRWGFTALPHPVKITHVYGKAIKVKKNPNVTDEEVEKLFEQWCAQVLRIFKEYGKKYLPPDVFAKELKIIRMGVDPDDRS